jgi:adenine phosphoribosyltransferase
MEDDIIESLYGAIRTVPDFPIEGIMFRDITPVLADGELLTTLVDRMVTDMDALGWQPTHIAGPESRGFIFGSMVAERLGVGFIPVRKPGKLPYEVVRTEYDLEYGSNALEVHIDAVTQGDRVVIVDDLLATGGTVAATAELCRELGAMVPGAMFLIELDGLGGSVKTGIETHSLLIFPA